jgi:rhamnosyltransferase
MAQIIGNDQQEAGWIRRYISFDHPPTRKYFIARNTVVTITTYFRQEPIWCLLQIFRLTMDVGAILSFESQKLKKLRAFARGLYHGAIGKMGPIEITCPNGF